MPLKKTPGLRQFKLIYDHNAEGTLVFYFLYLLNKLKGICHMPSLPFFRLSRKIDKPESKSQSKDQAQNPKESNQRGKGEFVLCLCH